MSDPTDGYMGRADWLPWNAPREWLLWLAITLAAAVIVHNVTRATAPKIGLPEGGSE